MRQTISVVYGISICFLGMSKTYATNGVTPRRPNNPVVRRIVMCKKTTPSDDKEFPVIKTTSFYYMSNNERQEMLSEILTKNKRKKLLTGEEITWLYEAMYNRYPNLLYGNLLRAIIRKNRREKIKEKERRENIPLELSIAEQSRIIKGSNEMNVK